MHHELAKGALRSILRQAELSAEASAKPLSLCFANILPESETYGLVDVTRSRIASFGRESFSAREPLA
jgi:hypothetical protein